MRRRDIKYLASDIAKLGRRMDEVAIPTLRKLQKILRDDAKKGYAASGLGRALWASGTKARGKPPMIVRAGKPRFSGRGGGYLAKVKAVGMAAHIEQGLRTKPHGIRAKKTKVLRFRQGDGHVFAAHVLHPGGRVERRSILRKGMEKLKPIAVSEMRRQLTILFKKVFH